MLRFQKANMPKRTLRLIHLIKRAQPNLAYAGMVFALLGGVVNLAGIKAGLMGFEATSLTHPLTLVCLLAIGFNLVFVQRPRHAPAWLRLYTLVAITICVVVVGVHLSGAASRELGTTSVRMGRDFGMMGLDTAIIALLLLVSLLLRVHHLRLMFVASAMSIELLALTTFAKLYDLPMFGLDMSLFTFLSLVAFQLSVVATVSHKQPFAVILLPSTTGQTTRRILAGLLVISIACGVSVVFFMRSFREEFNQLTGVAIVIALTTTVVLSAIQVILLAQTTHTEAVQRRIAKRRLERMAKTDMLTGVLNRHAGWDALSAYFDDFRTDDTPTSIAMIDIDHFKTVNDTHGHDIGDMVLKSFAATLHDHVGDNGIVCRWGGDEFIVILPDRLEDHAKDAIKEIRQILSQTTNIQVDDRSILNVTASIGASEFFADDSDPDAALRRADNALYEAKDAGRNALCWTDSFGVTVLQQNTA
ncbi:GGDEF domain-containing protein [Celeribacter sp.]|uniref:GGDEF domain-containing protein n=1 Tax=Celeribacter sp. TaxID=1890673 RepID=UPI003A943242